MVAVNSGNQSGHLFACFCQTMPNCHHQHKSYLRSPTQNQSLWPRRWEESKQTILLRVHWFTQQRPLSLTSDPWHPQWKLNLLAKKQKLRDDGQGGTLLLRLLFPENLFACFSLFRIKSEVYKSCKPCLTGFISVNEGMTKKKCLAFKAMVLNSFYDAFAFKG